MIASEEDIEVTKIWKQYKNIDLLVEVNGKYNIIIEDKTFSNIHDDQLNRYRTTLERENMENIVCVFLKVVEQHGKTTAHIEISRKDLLEIFSKYIDSTKSDIFRDFYENLLAIDMDVNAYKNTPISEWRVKFNHVYPGFFTHLIQDHILHTGNQFGWEYIPNQSNGFWGLWWYYLSKELEPCSLPKEDVDDLYLQIEDNIIAVKMTGDGTNTQEYRLQLYKYFQECIPGFNKKTFRKGKHMTVGFIEYDEINYAEKISIMENAMSGIANWKFNSTKSSENNI